MEFAFPSYLPDPPPGKLLCIGKNYARHAEEMHSDVPDEPMVFLKPRTALLGDGEVVRLPPESDDVHHEVELVARIGQGGRNIPQSGATRYVSHYAVGLDVTARDVQAAAKERGHPWSVAKGYDTFAPVGRFAAASDVADPQALGIELTVNGETRQSGSTRHMAFPLAELVAYCSRVFTLEEGDLLFTGTPEGVAPLRAGDEVEARVEGLPPLRVNVRS